jgi:hypothetical protein
MWHDIDTLEKLDVAELKARHLELFGEMPRLLRNRCGRECRCCCRRNSKSEQTEKRIDP